MVRLKKIQVKIKARRGIRLDYNGHNQAPVMDILVTTEFNSTTAKLSFMAPAVIE